MSDTATSPTTGGIVLDKRINIANLVSIFGSFALVVAMFVNLQTRVEFLECQVEKNNTLNAKVVRVETKVDGLSMDVKEIKGDIKTALGKR